MFVCAFVCLFFFLHILILSLNTIVSLAYCIDSQVDGQSFVISMLSLRLLTGTEKGRKLGLVSTAKGHLFNPLADQLCSGCII